MTGWYRQSWVIGVALVLAFPVGLFLMWRFAAWSPRTKKVVTSLAIWPAAAWWLWRAGAARWQTAAAAGAGALWVLIIIGVFVAPSTDSDDAAPGEPAAAAAQATPATPSPTPAPNATMSAPRPTPSPTATAASATPNAASPTPAAATPSPTATAASATPNAASPTPAAATPSPTATAASATPNAASPTPAAATPSPSPTPAAPTPTPTPSTSGRFGDGTYIVGVDIAPGRYRANNLSSFCSWSRLSGFGGSDLIDIDIPSGASAIVDIAPTDAGFKTGGCGSWSTDLSPVTASPTGPFSDGTYLVGADIAPGRYRTNSLSSFCSWSRLSGFGGSDIIDIDIPSGASAIVDIAPTDVGFETGGCGSWSTDLSPVTASPTGPFGDGTYLVGADIAPGRYRTTSLSSFCSWSRLSGFGGSDIIDIDIPSGASAIVDIAPTDVGFETNGCGSWSLLAG